MQAILYPEVRYFEPKAGSWLEQFIAESHVRTAFVSADGHPEQIIGTIQRQGTKYHSRLFRKPIKANSTARTVPAIIGDQLHGSMSSAVWDLRRRHTMHIETEGETQ